MKCTRRLLLASLLLLAVLPLHAQPPFIGPGRGGIPPGPGGFEINGGFGFGRGKTKGVVSFSLSRPYGGLVPFGFSGGGFYGTSITQFYLAPQPVVIQP